MMVKSEVVQQLTVDGCSQCRMLASTNVKLQQEVADKQERIDESLRLFELNANLIRALAGAERALRFYKLVAWLAAAIVLSVAISSCTWGYEDEPEQSLESLYCFNQAFACCNDDQVCENETYDNCCMYRDCEDGLITEEELEESKTCR